jgi:tape measure domain-containing protein
LATISSTLKMFDAFTGPLRKVTNGLNLTLKAMENLQGVTEKDNKMVKQFDAARKMIASADAELRKMAEDINKANKNQQRFNNSIKNSNSSMMKLAKSAAGVVAAYLSIREIKDFLGDLFSRGVEFNAFRQSASVAFTTFLGDAQKAQRYMDDMLSFAKTTPFAYPDLLTAGRNMIAFGMEAEKSFAVVKAIGNATAAIGGNSQKLTEIADVFGAIQVSGQLSMQEVNRLHTNGIQALEMLAEAFGTTGAEMKKQISKGAVGADAAIAILVSGINDRFGGMMEELKGTWAGAIDSLNSARRNAGADLVEPYMETLTNFIKNITSMIKTIPQYLGPAVAAFMSVVDMLNRAFESGNFEPFLQTMSMGLTVISWLLAGIANGAIWVAQTIGAYWPEITAMLIAWGATYLPIIISKLWGMVAALYAVGKAWLVAYWPIGLIVLAIGAVIFILRKLGVTNEQIIGSIIGAFAVLGAFIWNTVVGVINAIIQFLWTWFVEPWIGIIEWVLNVFNGGFNSFGDAVKNLLGQITSWFLSLGKVVTKIIDAIFGTDWTSGLSSLQDSLIKWGKNDQAITLSREASTIDSRIEYGSAWSTGYDWGSSVLNKMDNLTDKLGEGIQDPTVGFNHGLDIGEIDKVGEVGKIRDTVDISSEDLKLMRELAEMKNIQNFVTLTPTYQFGDMHVNNESDIDYIVSRITEKLEEDVSNSASGRWS